MRKSVFAVSDQVRHKPGCPPQKMASSLKFRISKAEGLRLYYVSKANALISCDVTALFSHMQTTGFLMTLLNLCALTSMGLSSTWLYVSTYI